MKTQVSSSNKCAHDRKGVNADSLHARLRSAGMKLTPQREQLLEILLHHPKPISADEIFKKIKKSGTDLVTVYRGLKKFEEGGLVTRSEFGDGVSRFELTVESGHHHHHVICKVCQKVEALHHCDLEPHLEMVRKMGYTDVGHRLDFFAICKECQAKTKE